MSRPARFAIAQSRGVVVATLALTALAATAVIAGVGYAARSSSSAAASQYGGKVTLCHHTHSTKNKTVTITVGQPALQAHMKHGDTLGACPPRGPRPSQPQQPAGTSTQAGSVSHGNGNGHGLANGHAKGH